MEKLNIGILGAGGMGHIHAEILAKREDVRITAVCDNNLHKAQELGGAFPATAYSNFDEMLSKEHLDILYILLPPYAHNGQFEKAAEHGIHIFIEKPIAITGERGRLMAEAAGRAGIKTQVGFHMRYGSAVKKLREMIAAGLTGRPVLFNGRYQCNSLHTPWWIDENRCGGQIFEQAIHLYDMCRYFFGHPGNVASFMENICHADVPGYTVEDVSASISTFTNGAKAAITATNCSMPGRWDAFFDVTFQNVSVFFQSPDEAEFHYIEKDGERVEYFREETDHKLLENYDFIDIVKNNKPAACPIEEGLRSLYYVEASLFSAKMNGKKTRVMNY